MAESGSGHTYDLAAHLVHQIAIDNVCLALVTVFPETPGRVDVYLPEFTTKRGFEPPGRSTTADTFWIHAAERLIAAEDAHELLVLSWRRDPLHVSAHELSPNRWVLTWQSIETPDPQLAHLIPTRDDDAVVRVTEEGILVEANPAYHKLGLGQPHSPGKLWVDTVPHGYADEIRALIAAVQQENATVQRIVVTRRHPPRWLHVRAHQILLNSGEPGIEITISDVTRTNVPRPEVMSQLMRDHLTGALNRRAFFNIVDSDAVSPAPFDHVVFIDVVGFKSINDTWGHTVGDQTLIEVARTLLHMSGQGDVVARLGGDEFVVLAMPGSPVEAAVRNTPASLVIAGGHRIPVSLRAGIARRTAGQTLSELVPQADHAVTAAKHDPSVRVQEWNPEISETVARRTTSERLLTAAFDEDRVGAHFQPLVNLDLRRVVGFEALLRVTGDEDSLPPLIVLETARRLGLADLLARRVAHSAFTEGKALLDRYPHSAIAVNLSREYLASGTAIEAMVSIADESGIPFDRITFELTEELAEGIPHAVLKAQVKRTRELGIGLMIDDFGRGETSLSLLRELRPSGIKLDRSLVPSEDDREGWRFVEGAIAMLATLSENLIVEGIERPSQSRRMHDLGLAIQQGWLFGRAEPAHHWLSHDIVAERPR
jgi:diguanylate cyclase (GGDEF)-like protein